MVDISASDLDGAVGGLASSAIGGLASAALGALGMGADPSKTAIAARFSVTLDHVNLGNFTKCEGLGVTVDTKPIKSAGNNSYTHTLRGGLKFSDIKVTRPVQEGNTDLMALVCGSGLLAKIPVPGTAVITLYSTSGKQIFAWTLHGAIPTGWTGPNCDVSSKTVATETLTISHKGPLAGAAGGILGAIEGAVGGALSSAIGGL